MFIKLICLLFYLCRQTNNLLMRNFYLSSGKSTINNNTYYQYYA